MKEKKVIFDDQKKQLYNRRISENKRSELILMLEAEYCRDHIMFQLNVDFKMSNCPELTYDLPKEVKVEDFEKRVVDF